MSWKRFRTSTIILRQACNAVMAELVSARSTPVFAANGKLARTSGTDDSWSSPMSPMFATLVETDSQKPDWPTVLRRLHHKVLDFEFVVGSLGQVHDKLYNL